MLLVFCIENYREIFEALSRLSLQDTLQLILESKTKEEKDFYEMIGNYLLRTAQRKVVEQNLF